MNNRQCWPNRIGPLNNSNRPLIGPVGSFHEPIGRLQRRVPLDHPPFTNLTIGAATVSNGQFGITHHVLCSAMPADELNVMGIFWVAHRCTTCALTSQYAIGFYNQHGTAKHWIKEGKKAVTRLLASRISPVNFRESSGAPLIGSGA